MTGISLSNALSKLTQAPIEFKTAGFSKTLITTDLEVKRAGLFERCFLSSRFDKIKVLETLEARVNRVELSALEITTLRSNLNRLQERFKTPALNSHFTRIFALLGTTPGKATPPLKKLPTKIASRKPSRAPQPPSATTASNHTRTASSSHTPPKGTSEAQKALVDALSSSFSTTESYSLSAESKARLDQYVANKYGKQATYTVDLRPIKSNGTPCFNCIVNTGRNFETKCLPVPAHQILLQSEFHALGKLLEHREKNFSIQ